MAPVRDPGVDRAAGVEVAGVEAAPARSHYGSPGSSPCVGLARWVVTALVVTALGRGRGDRCAGCGTWAQPAALRSRKRRSRAVGRPAGTSAHVRIAVRGLGRVV
ncbi:hypothetical protein GCM10023403_13580 [Pseudonocardia benzenivorans]|nr:hypothetical protein PSD17_23940 [Pseudonocardia sp. D17]